MRSPFLMCTEHTPLCKEAETEVELLGGHVEPCRSIPHTHPATVTCDSQSSSTSQQIKTHNSSRLSIHVGSGTGMQKEEKAEKKVVGLVCYIFW